MKWIPDFILYYVAFSLGIALIAVAVWVGKENNITRVNAVRKEARKAYLSAEYKKAFDGLIYLVDTLNFSRNEAKLNLAHSGYLAARIDSTQNVLRDIMKNDVPADSAALKKMTEEVTYATGLQYYDSVSECNESKLASIAFNQKGVVTYKMRDLEGETREEDALGEAAEYFKNALKKDPENEFARYNYELLRKKIQYPEAVMTKVRSLVHQRKYREARSVLQSALQKDNRMQKNYSDYVQRLENVISIDSLARS
jgi:hypothetical protein